VVRCDLQTTFIEQVDVAENGDLMLAGSASGVDAFEVSLTAVPEIWYPAEVSGDRFTARLPVTRTMDGVALPFPEGSYAIRARRPLVAGEEPQDVAARAADRLVLEFPTTHLRELAKVRLSRTDRGGVAVGLAAPVPDSDQGRAAQYRLINRYVTGEPRDIEDGVFFCTDLGSTVGDSALAIVQELRRRAMPLALYWGVTDRSVAVPDGVVPVVKHSTQWYEKVNTCRYVVNNYGGLWGLRKGPDQRYLQTWHGTPYKYIGVSESRHRNAPESRMQVIAAEAAEWDAIVSPSPYMTKLIASDLLFEGTVLETGYPRNDVLATATDDDVRALRTALGVPQHAKVMLYAPTFRENQRHGTKAELYDALDLDRLADLLGPDWCILLRGHGFNARNDQLDRSHGRLIDVTHHANINDLYITADALVTDYSSVMFDFSVTGKPMAFFTPDLKQYIASRGVYLDLAETVPGPLYIDVKNLADGLRDLDALAAEHADKYAAFRTQFTPWDDGKAAARVVETFFE
jgi:CDP-glycerol glycerophosphotransferase